MFGAAPPLQSETTPLHTRSPYAVAKVAAFWYGVNYHEAYGMFIANGTLFNYESPRRGKTFVVRKITHAAGCIKMGLQDKLYWGVWMHRRTGVTRGITWMPCGECSSRKMSLVGPRPFPSYHLDQFSGEFWELRTSVLPGVAGLWQISARSEGDLEVQEALDTYYIKLIHLA